MEITRSFQSLTEWQAFLAENPMVADPEAIEGIVAAACRNGVSFPFMGQHFPPEEVSVLDRNYRESLRVMNLAPRVRAVCDLFHEQFPAPDLSLKIFAPEALTPFALMFRGRYPKFLGSEYTDDPVIESQLYPIPVLDLMDMECPTGTFSAALVNDVLEHVPDIRQVLRELRRVMHDGGVLLSTQPFNYSCQDSIVRARIIDGKLVHLLPPEYHGDPVRPSEGVLVFEVPGWELLDWCRDAGFSHAEFVFVSSAQRGITGAEIAGVHVLRAFA